MKIVVIAWNAQGAAITSKSQAAGAYVDTWSFLYHNFMIPIRQQHDPDIVVACMTEAGEPPDRIKSTTSINTPRIVSGTLWRDQIPFKWYKWGNQNFRCSMGSFYVAKQGIWCEHSGARSQAQRPILTMKFEMLGMMAPIKISYAHLLSGAPAQNISKLQDFIKKGSRSGHPQLICGDMNIDILDKTTPGSYYDQVQSYAKTYKWYISCAGSPTHRGQSSNSELDWGISNHSCQADIIGGVAGSGTHGLKLITKGISDHAVIGYLLDV